MKAAAAMVAGSLALMFATAAEAQIPDTAEAPVDSVIVAPEVPVSAVPGVPDSLFGEPISPGGAFLRSMVLPGWGQSAFGSYFRGGVFFAGWVGNWFMIFRNQVRLGEARDRFDRRQDQLVDSLLAQPEVDPDSIRTELENTDLLDNVVLADTLGNDLRKLVRAREQQREDWIAWSIFWILASGIDGFVTAHLSDFPAAIDIQPNGDSSMSFRVTIPVGPPHP